MKPYWPTQTDGTDSDRNKTSGYGNKSCCYPSRFKACDVLKQIHLHEVRENLLRPNNRENTRKVGHHERKQQ